MKYAPQAPRCRVSETPYAHTQLPIQALHPSPPPSLPPTHSLRVMIPPEVL